MDMSPPRRTTTSKRNRSPSWFALNGGSAGATATDRQVGGAMKTLVWRRLDEPGVEGAHGRSVSSASGVQIWASYEVRWQLEGAHLELELNGERRTSVELGDADFFDVFA